MPVCTEGSLPNAKGRSRMKPVSNENQPLLCQPEDLPRFFTVHFATSGKH